MSEGKHDNLDEPVKYEGWEIHLKPVLYFLFYLSLGTIFVAVLMYSMFWFLEDRAKREDEVARRDNPLASERQVIPQKPILQLAPTEPGQANPRILTDHPLIELRNLKKDYQDQLDSYGWIDKNAGVVHIPIDKAKELLFERGGLQSRPEGQPQPPASFEPKAEMKNTDTGSQKPKPAGSSK